MTHITIYFYLLLNITIPVIFKRVHPNTHAYQCVLIRLLGVPIVQVLTNQWASSGSCQTLRFNMALVKRINSVIANSRVICITPLIFLKTTQPSVRMYPDSVVRVSSYFHFQRGFLHLGQE